MKVIVRGFRVELEGESEDELWAMRIIAGVNKVRVDRLTNTSIGLSPIYTEDKTKVETEPEVTSSPAVAVANYLRLLLRDKVPYELAEKLTLQFQEQLLADHFGTGNGERCH